MPGEAGAYIQPLAFPLRSPAVAGKAISLIPSASQSLLWRMLQTPFSAIGVLAGL
jgi:hypothetical protein